MAWTAHIFRISTGATPTWPSSARASTASARPNNSPLPAIRHFSSTRATSPREPAAGRAESFHCGLRYLATGSSVGDWLRHPARFTTLPSINSIRCRNPDILVHPPWRRTIAVGLRSAPRLRHDGAQRRYRRGLGAIPGPPAMSPASNRQQNLPPPPSVAIEIGHYLRRTHEVGSGPKTPAGGARTPTSSPDSAASPPSSYAPTRSPTWSMPDTETPLGDLDAFAEYKLM